MRIGFDLETNYDTEVKACHTKTLVKFSVERYSQ
jgi:hypothetical protein